MHVELNLTGEPAEDPLANLSFIERIALLPPQERKWIFRGFSEEKLILFFTSWINWARRGQLEPDGDWRIWLMMAGRGFGKTRAGSEWMHHLAEEKDLRLALVGPTADEVRAVMVEGSAGLLATAHPEAQPAWEPSRGVVTWPTGTQAFVYSGANPESLRGPEHDFAWCDELAKWARAEACWDNMMLGLRRGRYPRVLATTTPRPVPLMRRLRGRSDVVETSGRTRDNVQLAEDFVRYVTEIYGGTRLGRQELDGELIEDVEGALWKRELIERCRVSGEDERDFSRIVIGVDPPASAGGACGIVAVGLGRDGLGYVLGDHSVRGAGPEGWAGQVAHAFELHEADRIVAENNMGGDMVESVLRSVELSLPVKPVRASRGKSARAEPVAGLFERGRAKFVGCFPELEDELAGLTTGGDYQGPGSSPDRADAMVWALTELMLGKEARMPRIIQL
jgi:phage terminase large subunit-like protein